MRRTPRPMGAQGGFTLLEVMVAVAIMAMALVSLIGIVTSNVRAAAHARHVTLATLLARAKMAGIEDLVYETGFVDNDQEEEGDFGDEGHSRYRWYYIVEKVELPADAALKAQEAASDTQQQAATGPSANPMAALTGMMGGLMSTFVEPIRLGLEQSVRRVTVRVLWDEVARGEQSFELVSYMTDPGKLDMSLPALAGAAAGSTGVGGAGGTATGGGAGGGTGTGTSGARNAPPTPTSGGRAATTPGGGLR